MAAEDVIGRQESCVGVGRRRFAGGAMGPRCLLAEVAPGVAGDLHRSV